MRYFTLASGAHTTLRLSGFPPLSGVPFSLTVYNRYVIVDGTGEISVEEAKERCHSISTRYWGKERGERFARKLIDEDDTVVLSVRPNRVLTESNA